MSERYSQRGVSSDKSDVHFAIRNLDKGLYPRAFCKVLPDLMLNDPEACVIMHADGAGTKSSLAYLYWRETGDISVWRGIVQDGIVMNIDDMMCVGACDSFLLSNTIGRNSFLIPKEVLAEMLNGMEDFFEMLREHGIQIVNTGGETADVPDVVKTLIFDATAYSRMPRSAVITNENIGPGSVIVGLSSAGQAKYETTYNSGIGSNGLTSARHDVLSGMYREKYPETYDISIPEHLAYSGQYTLDTQLENHPLSVGKLLLSPTRTYLPFMREVFGTYRQQIHGLIHCTGGGQTKILKFIEHLRVVKNNLLPIPPIFSLIQSSSQTDWKEMYKVFNMGHRLEIYTDPATAQGILSLADKFHIEAGIIGFCEAAETNQLIIESDAGSFMYS
ncbi:MAG: AIR synthase related protein [Bacteroidota bacterium]